MHLLRPLPLSAWIIGFVAACASTSRVENPAAPAPKPDPAAAAAPATGLAPAPFDLDAYVDESLAAWGAPGMAIAVVRGGDVIYARGHGVRELGKPGHVDENTRFAIASLTKTFTAATAGSLVTQSQIAWDDPVTRHLPGFALADAGVSAALTLRDLLAHRSGISDAANLLWFGTGYERADILGRLRLVGQATPLRTAYSYSNVLYLAAGEAMARGAGQPWDELVRTRLLVPLGMHRTATSFDALQTADNVAHPHDLREGVLRPIAYRNADNIGPAASMSSSAADLARWLRMWLGRGALGSARILDEAIVDEMLTPQMLINLPPWARALYPESHFQAYGLGWVLQDYRGRLVAWNTGGLDGMACSIAIVPEERLGVVVLTNVPWTGLPEGMIFRVLDAHLGAPDKDWSAIRLRMSLASRERIATAQREREGERQDHALPLPPERYAGRFTSALVGDAVIEQRGDGLVLRVARSLEGELEPWRGPVLRVRFHDAALGTALVTVSVTPDGTVSDFEIPDYSSFTRVRDRQPRPASSRPRPR
jgi:CubicO group peptidase (beta-lactamase class C family)